MNLQRIWTLNSWPLHNCSAEQQSGGEHVLVRAKADRQAAISLWKKCHGAEGSIADHAVQLQSLRSYQA